MKIYVTKYALTKGILEFDATLNPEFPEWAKARSDGYWPMTFYGNDWHRTEIEAIGRARDMREKEISRLKQRIKKLEKMEFKRTTT